MRADPPLRPSAKIGMKRISGTRSRTRNENPFAEAAASGLFSRRTRSYRHKKALLRRAGRPRYSCRLVTTTSHFRGDHLAASRGRLVRASPRLDAGALLACSRTKVKVCIIRPPARGHSPLLERVRAMHRDGVGPGAMAGELGISRMSVHRALNGHSRR